MANNATYLASWSGGKDSCLALMRAIDRGLSVAGLMHFDRDYGAHGIDASHVARQADAAGIELVNTKVSAGDDFEAIFKKVIQDSGVHGVVFGDIYLNEHRDWLERVCGEIGVEAVFPIWGEDTVTLAGEFITGGGETVVVSVKSGFVNPKWAGHVFDMEFVDYLTGKGLDPCGENGEFHTFVTNCRLFSERVPLQGSGTYEREGHWFYDVRN